ncbi:protein of unknown function [Ralstonia solanacearum CMR15]|nr:protein of unknown function [Ralstonia solanacearum CMR15]
MTPQRDPISPQWRTKRSAIEFSSMASLYEFSVVSVKTEIQPTASRTAAGVAWYSLLDRLG